MCRPRPGQLLLVDWHKAVAVVVWLPLVEQGKAALDALQLLDQLTFESNQHALGIVIGATADLVRLAVALGDDRRGLDVSRLGQLPFLDQERRLLLGARKDA